MKKPSSRHLLTIHHSYDVEFVELMKKMKHISHYEELLELDGIGSQLDVSKFSKKFFSGNQTTADVSVDANSNVDDASTLQYEREVTKPRHRLNAYYLLWKYSRKLFGSEIAEDLLRAQFTKSIYTNDFHTMGIRPYCYNFSCMDIVYNGLTFIKKIKVEPPKHLTSFIGQMATFVIYASNSISGAVGLADFNICASWYVDKLLAEGIKEGVSEKYIWKQIKQEFQSFIFLVNQPLREGLQSPFTNVSIFDEQFLDKLCKEYLFPNQSHPKKETVQKIQELYIDLMNETLRKTPITFPVTTACFSVDDDRNILDQNFLNMISKKDREFAFINMYAGKTSTLSSCCRLRSDSEDNEYFNMFGSGGTKIGSASVATINLPRIAYTTNTVEAFLEELEKKVEMVSRINHVRKHILKIRIENKHAPLYNEGLISLKTQYSTCGIVGVNEAVEIMKMNILEEEGQQFVTQILDTINTTNARQQKRYNEPHNCEQVPGESSSIKVAQADRILGYNKKYELYSNQFIPLISEADMYDRIKLQGMFDDKMTGGAILHLNFVDRITDLKFIKDLTKEIIKAGVVYHAKNYNLQSCENGHMTVGKSETCEVCGEPITANFTRVVGFLVAVKNFHKVRREKDYPNRQFYKK